MQHRIEPSNQGEPIELADENLPVDSNRAWQPRNEHRIEPVAQTEPLALAADIKTTPVPKPTEVSSCAQTLATFSHESPASDVIAMLETGLRYQEALQLEVSRVSQIAGSCARAYEALKIFVPILKEISSEPITMLEALKQVGSDHISKQVLVGSAKTDSRFFDALRMGIVLGFEAGLRDSDVPAAGGIGEERSRSALLTTKPKKPVVVIRSQEQKDAERAAKIARMKGVALTDNDNSEDSSQAAPKDSANEVDSTDEIIQQETTQAREHVDKAKIYARHFKPLLGSALPPILSLKKSNPEQYQDRIYALASTAAEWLQAEVGVSSTLQYDPAKVRERRSNAQNDLATVQKLAESLQLALQHAAHLVNTRELLGGAAAEISYHVRQMTAERPVGIRHSEVVVSAESVARAQTARLEAEATRARARDPIKMDRFTRDGEQPKVGGF
jgi:hypothetical protein